MPESANTAQLREDAVCAELRLCLPTSPMNSEALLVFAIGYALGSVPFGLLLTRLTGKGDLRAIGSGNIGATNVLRTGSKALAALTLLLDALKGTAAVLLARWCCDGHEHVAAAGALIGHLYPVWLRFRGGKGVATFLGILIALLPIAAAAYAAIWVLLLLTIRISSVAGIAAAVSAPVTAALIGNEPRLPMLLGFALLVVWKHRTNIARLKAGTEPRIGRDKGA
jgi:glycerol-3-phosphate acyltransferase PlsY